MNILILGCARTGSSYLLRLVETYTGYTAHSEPFGKDNIPYITPFLRGTLKHMLEHWEVNDNIVIKIHANHMEQGVIKKMAPDFYKQVPSVPDYTIGLIRKDLVSMAMSLTYSIHTGQWRSPYRPIVIDADPVAFKKYLHGLYTDQCKIIENKWGFKYDEIVFYEDIKDGDDLSAYNKLNLSTIIPPLESIGNMIHQPDLLKAPKKNVVIRNYDELINIAMEHSKEIEDNPYFVIKDCRIVDLK